MVQGLEGDRMTTFENFMAVWAANIQRGQIPPEREAMQQEFSVVIKVLADTSAEAVDLACERLNMGGEPDAVLTGLEIEFPDPDSEGQQVRL